MNKEQKKEYMREWRKKNPDYRKRYYENNKEKERTLSKEWDRNNKEKKLEINKKANSNYRKNNPIKTEARIKSRKEIKTGICRDCNKKKETEFHHISYEPHVVIELCKKCHYERHKDK